MKYPGKDGKKKVVKGRVFLCPECHKNKVRSKDQLCSDCYDYYIREVYYPDDTHEGCR